LEIYAVFWFENTLASQMISAIICDCLFIADFYDSFKLWVSYTEYTIPESSLGGVILYLRYGNDISILKSKMGYRFVGTIQTFSATNLTLYMYK
jgi:hypothetical protein